MSTDELIRAGRLPEALAAAIENVRRAPADPTLRMLLCQVMTVMGQWERALTQWQVLAETDSDAALLAKTCAALVRIEDERRAVFSGEKLPMVFGEPEAWAGGLLQAGKLAAGGNFAAARTLLEETLDQVPSVGGTLNGESFEWIADADSRLGPMLEAVLDGRYFWIPFHRIRSMLGGPPASLRDLVWTPFRFTWTNGGTAAGYVPARYVGTEKSTEGAMLLARKTEWVEMAEGWFHGVGQRMFSTDQKEYALLDVRLLEFAPISADGAPASHG